MCGGRMDAVALRLGLSCTVVTNDVRNSFPREYLEKAGQPDWVVTSPPYRGAINFVKSALGVARYGVALKLPLSFLEPCADRGIWLKENPPSVCVVLRRVTHTPAHVIVGESWGVWYKETDGSGTRMAFCP
ncbi:unnamed protein product [Pylaiella littoralis]